MFGIYKSKVLMKQNGNKNEELSWFKYLSIGRDYTFQGG